MSAIGTKLRQSEDGKVLFRCPGCDAAHGINVGKGPGPRRGWNGSGDAPTFTPSVRVRGIRAPDGREVMTPAEEAEYDAIFAAGGSEAVLASRFGTTCHTFVTDGRIQFLDDCSHKLAGQTVDLPDWDSKS